MHKLISKNSEDAWEEDCLAMRGKKLIGNFSHWCPDWDGLPIDETCPEWPCVCEEELRCKLDGIEH